MSVNIRTIYNEYEYLNAPYIFEHIGVGINEGTDDNLYHTWYSTTSGHTDRATKLRNRHRTKRQPGVRGGGGVYLVRRSTAAVVVAAVADVVVVRPGPIRTAAVGFAVDCYTTTFCFCFLGHAASLGLSWTSVKKDAARVRPIRITWSIRT